MQGELPRAASLSSWALGISIAPFPGNPPAHIVLVLCYQLAREVLDIAASHIKPGVTTDFIDEVVHNATIERNAYPSPLNYRGFPKSVCT